MLAVGLVRVSTQAQVEEGYSLERQEALVRDYCHREADVLIDVIQDAGVTGKALDREGLDRLDALIQAKAVQKIVIARMDRLSREPWRALQLVSTWRQHGIRVVMLNRPNAGDTPIDQFYEVLEAGLAGLEWAKIRELTTAGRYSKAQAGRLPSFYSCLGYDQVARWEEQAHPELAGQSGTLRVNEAEAAVVRHIFRRVAEGATLTGLAKELNAAGYRGKTGVEWSMVTVRHIIENPAYKGEAVYGKNRYRTIHLPGGGKVRSVEAVSPEEWLRIPCPALVSVEQWEHCQERLGETATRFVGRQSVVWILRGCIVCEKCTGQRGLPRNCTGARRTRCKGRKNYHVRQYKCPVCDVSYSAPRLEALALRQLAAATLPGAMGAKARRQAEESRRDYGGVTQRLEQVRAELRALDQEERQVAKLILRGISAPIVDETLASIQARRAEANGRLRGLTAQVESWADPDAAEEAAERYAASLRAELAATRNDPAGLQALYQRSLRIVLRRGKPPQLEIKEG